MRRLCLLSFVMALTLILGISVTSRIANANPCAVTYVSPEAAVGDEWKAEGIGTQIKVKQAFSDLNRWTLFVLPYRYELTDENGDVQKDEDDDSLKVVYKNSEYNCMSHCQTSCNDKCGDGCMDRCSENFNKDECLSACNANTNSTIDCENHCDNFCDTWCGGDCATACTHDCERECYVCHETQTTGWNVETGVTVQETETYCEPREGSCNAVPYQVQKDHGCIEIGDVAYPLIPGTDLQNLISAEKCGHSDDEGIAEVIFNQETHVVLDRPFDIRGALPGNMELRFNWCGEDEEGCNTNLVKFHNNDMLNMVMSCNAGENSVCNALQESDVDRRKPEYGTCSINIGSKVRVADIYMLSWGGDPVCFNGDNSKLKDSEIVNEYSSIKINGDNNTLERVGFLLDGIKVESGSGNKIKELVSFASRNKPISISEGANDGVVQPTLRVRPITNVICEDNDCLRASVTTADGATVNMVQNQESPCSKTLFLDGATESCSDSPESPNCFLVEASAAGADYIELYQVSGYDHETGQPTSVSTVHENENDLFGFKGCTNVSGGNATALIKVNMHLSVEPYFAITATKGRNTSEFSQVVPLNPDDEVSFSGDQGSADSDGDGISDSCEASLERDEEHTNMMLNLLIQEYDLTGYHLEEFFGLDFCEHHEVVAGDCDSEGILSREGLAYHIQGNACDLARVLAGDIEDSCHVNTVDPDGCFWDFDQDGLDDLRGDPCLGTLNIDSDGNGLCDDMDDSDNDGVPDGLPVEDDDADGVSRSCEEKLAGNLYHTIAITTVEAIAAQGYNIGEDVTIPFGPRWFFPAADSYEYSFEKLACNAGVDTVPAPDIVPTLDEQGMVTLDCLPDNIDFATDAAYYSEGSNDILAVLAGDATGRVNTVNVEGCFYDFDQDGVDDIADNCFGPEGDLDSNGNGICDLWEDVDGNGIPDAYVPAPLPGGGADGGQGDGDDNPDGGGELVCESGYEPDETGEACVMIKANDPVTNPGEVVAECDIEGGMMQNSFGECVPKVGATVSTETEEVASAAGGCSFKKKSDGTYGCSLTGGGTMDMTTVLFPMFLGLLSIMRGIISRRKR